MTVKDGDTNTAAGTIDETATALTGGETPPVEKIEDAPAADAAGEKPEGDKPEGDKPAGDKPAGDTEGEKPDSDSEDGDEADKDKEGAPEEYAEFVIPEGFESDDAKMGEFQTWAKAEGLSQKQAQAAIEKAAERETALREGQYKEWADTQAKWVDEGKADKEFGGDNYEESVGVAKRAIDAFGTDELKTALAVTGAGNHPEFIRFCYRIGKGMSEDNINPSRTLGNESKDTASILYPDAT